MNEVEKLRRAIERAPCPWTACCREHKHPTRKSDEPVWCRCWKATALDWPLPQDSEPGVPVPQILSPELLDADQQAAITRLIEYDHTLLIAGMGAGKTVIAATAIAELLDSDALARVLVLAPLKTLETVWPAELSGWSHLVASHSMRSARLAIGNVKARTAALESEARLVLVNFENLRWLIEAGYLSEFDGLLVDESSKLKATGGAGFKALRRYVEARPDRVPTLVWTAAMSGTPVSEDLIGLFGQMLLVDGGASLGRNRQKYLDRFFVPVDFDQRQWEPRTGSEAAIAGLVAPWVHVVPDYTHTLPPLTVETVPVDMPAAAWGEYRLLARNAVLDDVRAANEAVLTGKLQQVASGFIYPNEPGDAPLLVTDASMGTQLLADGTPMRWIHDGKLAVLDQLLADDTAPALIVYWWAAHREALERRGIPLLDAANVERWNAGELSRLAMHPRSAGHGLNLQDGGSRVIWLAPQWSRDLFDQVNARVWRRGQRSPVTVQILASAGTVDDLVLERLEGKAGYHARFVAHMEALRADAPDAPGAAVG